MGIEFKDSGSFREQFTRELEQEQKKALEIAAAGARATIISRTTDGKDYKGRGFKRYTDKYREFKKSKGRSSKPDLTFTGNMLAAIQVENATRNSVELGFGSSKEASKAQGNQEKRPFFDLSEKEFDQFVEDYKRNLKLFKEQ